MVKTRDAVRADMLMYLKAAKDAMHTLEILDAAAGQGAAIIRLACSFKQSDVLEEAVAKEAAIEQMQIEEQQRQEERARRKKEARDAISEY